MNGYVYNVSNAGALINEDQWEVSVQEGDNVVFIWNKHNFDNQQILNKIDSLNTINNRIKTQNCIINICLMS